ncbi:MAG TPA: hypothetical protein PK308_10155 [Phycisphaerales bacterium]|nr:hypothetical protein [Phycisphaerales bacterium]
MPTITTICLAAIAAGLFFVAYELRQLRFGKVDSGLVDSWWRAVARYAPVVQDPEPPRKDY